MPRLLIAILSLVFAAPAVVRGLTFTSIVDGAVVPANWLYPIITWADEAPTGTEYVLAVTAGAQKLTVVTKDKHFVPTGVQFARFLTYPTVRFLVQRPDATGGVASAGVSVKVDNEALGDTIVYRMVQPLFNPDQDAMLRRFRLDEMQSSSVAAATSLCVGCHSYREGAAALNARRGRDRRLITSSAGDDRRPFSAQRLGEFSFMSISPDAKTLALVARTQSIIKLRSTFIEPFDMVYTAGDICLLEAGATDLRVLPGASDPDFVEDSPSWSADGDTLVFSRYRPSPGAVRLNPVGLYTIAVNSGRGGIAKRLLERPPSEYCFFPNFSPDGKWISFVSADASGSYFARRSSDIWLFSTVTGKAHRLECNVPDAMDSWHAWSSDSKWLVFSSNRDADGLTSLYLSRIESDGKAMPPVRITLDSKMKANLPVMIPPTDRKQIDVSGFLKQVFGEP